MVKRFSTLILALLLGGSALARTATRNGEHVCEKAAMEAMPGCEAHQSLYVLSESSSSEECCFITPQETGSRGTTFNLRAPSFSIAVVHPAVVQSPPPVLKAHQSSYSAVLHDLQASYIRNLSLLI